VTVSPSGWVTKEIFAQFGLLFLNFLHNKGYLGHDRAHVVILDNHHSHLFNLEFLKLMKDNNIHVIGLPPHTSHWLQPLDKVHFGVLKKAWNKEVRAFTRDTVGKKVEKSDFFRVFNPATLRTISQPVHGSWPLHGMPTSFLSCEQLSQDVWS